MTRVLQSNCPPGGVSLGCRPAGLAIDDRRHADDDAPISRSARTAAGGEFPLVDRTRDLNIGVDPAYITLLRDYDITRDAKPLAAFVPVRRMDDEEFW